MPQKDYKTFEKFILRTPLLPINFIKDLLSDDKNTYDKIKQACNNKVVQEAIFLASPNLLEKIQKWIKGELKDKKEVDNLPQSVYKYLARMSSRCTPFGLFAGNSVGKFNEANELKIVENKYNKRVTRLDMNYLCALIQDLSKRSDIREIVNYYPNNSLYEFGDKLRYVEYYYHNTKRTHHIAAVDSSDYLLKVLKVAENSAKLKQLAETLVDDDITLEEATEFINELIDSQLLVSEIEPSVTGKGELVNILNFLKDKDIKNNPYKLLNEVNDKLIEIDNSILGVDPEKYYEIADKLKEIDTKYELKFLFQTDMVKPVENISISNEIKLQINRAIEVLNAFSRKPGETNLTKFRDAFYKRYEDAEMPLLQVLDTESGIGYLQDYSVGAGDYSPLVDNIQLPGSSSQSRSITWNPVYTYFFKKYIEAIKNNQYQVEITDKEIKELSIDDSSSNLPVTISSMVQLVNVDGQEKIIMSSAGSSSAANLLGRFCHTEEQIFEHVKCIVDKEEEFYQDQVIAEVVHLPESRTGNILHRPVLRNYEIPYLAKPSVSNEMQVLPEDLWISVKRNRIILRSRKLNKEIVPRLSTAHNFTFNSLPMYQFLCDMQTQDLKTGVGFSWGPLSGNYKFQPRVCYKNLIFSVATWNIEKVDFEKIANIKDDSILIKELTSWRNDLNMPEWVTLEEGDNELLIKLSSVLSVKTLISLVKKRPGFVLKEFLAGDENMMVKGNDGSYTNEVIFTFYREN